MCQMCQLRNDTQPMRGLLQTPDTSTAESDENSSMQLLSTSDFDCDVVRLIIAWGIWSFSEVIQQSTNKQNNDIKNSKIMS